MCESVDKSHIEMLVCTQDWLTPAGMTYPLLYPISAWSHSCANWCYNFTSMRSVVPTDDI
jgi:hypothetical protein